LLGAAIALVCGLAANASAEVRVEGNPAALRVSASGDELSAVLSAVGDLFPLKYHTEVPLNLEIRGNYSGSLSRVISRLLDSYNYVIKNDQGRTEIIIFGKRGEAMVSPKVAVPVTKGAMSRWR
jgi:hypothetical protein